MIGKPFYYSSALKDLHKEALLRLEKYSKAIVPTGLPRAGESIHDILLSLDHIIKYTLFLNSTQTKEIQVIAAQMDSNEANFYQSLCRNLNQAYVYCGLLHASIDPKLDDAGFYLDVGYIYLLMACLKYNIAVYSEKYGNREIASRSLDECFAWLSFYEIKIFARLDNDNEYTILQKALTDCIASLQFQQDTLGERISKAALECAIEARNKRRALLSDDLPSMVVSEPDCFLMGSISKNASALLLKEILLLLDSPNKRKQFLFYLNHETGPIDVFDIQYNRQMNRFEIIHVSSSPHDLQHALLQQLLFCLNTFDSSIGCCVVACRADKLTKAEFAPEYAYVLSHQIAKLPISQFLNEKFKTKQPRFTRPDIFADAPFDSLPIHWFQFRALGEKAFLLTSPDDALELFLEHMKKPEAVKKAIDSYRKKYGVGNTKLFLDCHPHYLSYVRAKLLGVKRTAVSLMELVTKINDDMPEALVDATAKELASMGKPTFSPHKEIDMNALMSRLSSLTLRAENPFHKDCAKALRRAAAGLCTAEDFDDLLAGVAILSPKEKSAILNGFDIERKYAPIHLSIERSRPRRAKALYDAGASLELPNKDGRKAKDLLDAAPLDSPLRKLFLLKA